MSYIPEKPPTATVRDENHYLVEKVLLETTVLPQSIIVHVIGYALEPADYHVLLRSYHHQLTNRVCPRLIFKTLVALELLPTSLRAKYSNLPVDITKIISRRNTYYNKHCKSMSLFKATSEKFWYRTMILTMKDWTLAVEKKEELNYLLTDESLHVYLMTPAIVNWTCDVAVIHVDNDSEVCGRNYQALWYGNCALLYHAMPKVAELVKVVLEEPISNMKERDIATTYRKTLDQMYRKRISHFAHDYQGYLQTRATNDLGGQYNFKLGLGLTKDAWWCVRNMKEELLRIVVEIGRRRPYSLVVQRAATDKWARKETK